MIADAYASTCLVLEHEKAASILEGLPFYTYILCFFDDSINDFQIFELHDNMED